MVNCLLRSFATGHPTCEPASASPTSLPQCGSGFTLPHGCRTATSAPSPVATPRRNTITPSSSQPHPNFGRACCANSPPATRLWALDEISARPAGIGQPQWDPTGVDEYLPDRTPIGGENATAPLAEDMVGPLLVWAIRVVDDLADDILNARAERQRLAKAIPAAPSRRGDTRYVPTWTSF